MNRTWGTDLRPADPEEIRKKLTNGLKNKNPQSSLAHALRQKKTIRLGNKTDPYQDADKEYKVTREAVRILRDLNWTYLIQSKFMDNMNRDLDLFDPALTTFMPVISPGLEKDWEILERKKTTPIHSRLKFISERQKEGYNIGVNGEPFIPGYHTIDNFEEALRVLKNYDIKSYNTYHLHFNDIVAKNLHEAGIDIEKIFYANQDENWRPVLKQLIDLAQKYDIVLGCPDFVNSGAYQSEANTCCGINVPNPCEFTILNWKKKKMKGLDDEEILRESFDGIGSLDEGREILCGTDPKSEFYGYKDIVWSW
jgi:DNA repair photolyase